MDCLLKRRVLLALACALTLLAQYRTSHGDTEAPRVVLGPAAKDLAVRRGMDARGWDLRGSEFVGQDLTGAHFDGCSLWHVRFEDCILNHASFRGTIFTGARVSVGPNLNGADFTDATINGVCNYATEGRGFRFYRLDLSPRQLMSTWSYKSKDLHQCAINASYPFPSREVASFDFRGADLREATLQGDCSKCDFTNARIYGAFFGNDSITFEQLASTWDFRQCRLCVRLSWSGKPDAVSLGNWDFSDVNLAGSDVRVCPSDAEFTRATIRDCTIRNGLTKEQLYSTRSYQLGDLTGLRLMSSDLSGCDLSGMNLTGSSFEHCNFAGTKFDDAVITDALFLTHNYHGTDQQLTKSDGLTLEQIKSTWNYKHGHLEGIRLPDDIREALRHREEKLP